MANLYITLVINKLFIVYPNQVTGYLTDK